MISAPSVSTMSRAAQTDMHNPQEQTRGLLTARQVQNLLHVDRSTVYRMADDGRLPAIKVGRQWRFPADRIGAILHPLGTDLSGLPTEPVLPAEAAPPARAGLPATAHLPGEGSLPRARAEQALPPSSSPAPPPGAGALHVSGHVHQRPDAAPLALTETGLALVGLAAELLGVMLVVTDMDGHPVTPVLNQCPWFAQHADEPEIVETCVAEWQSMADDPDFEPRFHPGALGFQCARAFIRSGSSLVGMVLVGGVAPEGSTLPGLYQLEPADRRRVLAGLPKVAAALSRVTPRGAALVDQGSRS